MKYLVALLLVLLLAATAHSATLTFTDTSTIEKGFLVLAINTNVTPNTFTWIDVPSLVVPNVSGQKVLIVPQGVGFCFVVAAYSEGGFSASSNRACLGVPAPGVAGGSTSLSVTP